MTKALGILGGMSWVSTLTYYRLLNEAVAAARGRQHSAPLLVASVDFQPIVDAQTRGDWDEAGRILAAACQGLERAGAGAFLIASNTMHKVLPAVRASVSIPALDIFDAIADAIRAAGLTQVGLLGTRYTMSDPFFSDAYAQRGIKVLKPRGDDARLVNEIIFRELIHGTVRPESAASYRQVIARLADQGAEGVILGCTEIALLVKEGDVALPVFDSTALHAAQAAAWLL